MVGRPGLLRVNLSHLLNYKCGCPLSCMPSSPSHWLWKDYSFILSIVPLSFQREFTPSENLCSLYPILFFAFHYKLIADRFCYYYLITLVWCSINDHHISLEIRESPHSIYFVYLISIILQVLSSLTLRSSPLNIFPTSWTNISCYPMWYLYFSSLQTLVFLTANSLLLLSCDFWYHFLLCLLPFNVHLKLPPVL